MSGSVRSGNSGGPLVDPGGDVVGTVFAATTSGPLGGFAIPAEQVRDALRGIAKKSTPGLVRVDGAPVRPVTYVQ